MSTAQRSFGNACCVCVGIAYMIRPMDALDHAIAIAGTQGALAKSLGIRSPSISEWRARGRIPIERCRDIVRATHGAVSLSDLRPDIWPPGDPHSREVA